MKDKIYGITVAHLLSDQNIAFGQIKNSISGTSLSGNWVFSSKQRNEITSICRSHILISNLKTRRALEAISKVDFTFGDFPYFLTCVKDEELNLKNEWEAHIFENPKKAKTLVTPVWPSWQTDLSIEDPIQALTRSGKSAHPDSTPDDMKSLIALARIVRHALDNWRDLEDIRIGRKYLGLSKGEPRLWPPAWEIKVCGSN